VAGGGTLTIGNTYYISTTAGSITTTAPANAKVVGLAQSSTVLVVSYQSTSSVGDLSVSGTLGVTGAATLSSTLAVTGATTLSTATMSTVAPSTPTAATLYKDSLVSGWVDITVSAGTPSITDDFNVSSLTDNGTGDTTVTWATAIGSATYAAVASPRANNNRLHASCYSFASGSVRVYTYNDSLDTAADGNVSMVAVGA